MHEVHLRVPGHCIRCCAIHGAPVVAAHQVCNYFVPSLHSQAKIIVGLVA